MSKLFSLQVRDCTLNCLLEFQKYSTLCVLNSYAGYYIGTTYSEGSATYPGSRDSNYFPLKSQAEEALSYLELLSEGKPYPFDLTVWEMKMADQFRFHVFYRYTP